VDEDAIFFAPSFCRCYIFESMDGYESGWRTLRHRRNQLLLAFIGYVPITFALAVLADKLFHSYKLPFVFALSWMLLFAIASIWYSRFPCPRCGKPFFSTWLYHNGFARRWVHCKLPLYSAK
jgi:hypothetical protein